MASVRQRDPHPDAETSSAPIEQAWGSAGWLLAGLAVFLLLASGTLTSLFRDLNAWRSGEPPPLRGIPLSAPNLGDGATPDRVAALTAGLPPVAALDASQPGLAPVASAEERAAAVGLIQAVRTAPDRPDNGYDRRLFGPAWSDGTNRLFGRNGCDTRNDILARDLQRLTLLGGGGCVVASGTLVGPYTGATFEFAKTNAAAIHIDHIYPLSVAWRMGAARWDDATRLAFANEPLNLLAVDGPANEDKGALTPSSWLPIEPNRCAFAVRYAAVALRYDLPVTEADRSAMANQCR